MDVDIEPSFARGHPAVKEAAVVAAPHPKWQERPLAAVVLKEGCQVTADELRSFLACKFAKWQVPDEFIFVPSLPPYLDWQAAEIRIAEAVPALGVVFRNGGLSDSCLTVLIAA